MLITKRGEVTKQGFCKILRSRNSVFRQVSYPGSLISTFNFNLIVNQVDGVSGGRLFEFDWEGEGGWALIRGWVLIKFFCL